MRSGGQLLARLGRFNLVGLLGAALQLLLLCLLTRYLHMPAVAATPTSSTWSASSPACAKSPVCATCSACRKSRAAFALRYSLFAFRHSLLPTRLFARNEIELSSRMRSGCPVLARFWLGIARCLAGPPAQLSLEDSSPY